MQLMRQVNHQDGDDDDDDDDDDDEGIDGIWLESEKNWHQRCFTCRQCKISLVNQKYYEKVLFLDNNMEH